MAEQEVKPPLPLGRDIYETWWQVEKAIIKLDRIFNKVEKFDGRKFTDPENHERREARMLSRKRDRNFNNFTFFFGGLTEEEQQYRDYYQTDIEENPEDEALEDKIDEDHILSSGDFHHGKFDFVETNLGANEQTENFEDVIEDKIFKYKYRKANDYGEVNIRRENRMISRFFKRVQTRDAEIERDVHGLISEGQLKDSIAAVALGEVDTKRGNFWVDRETKPLRDYMLAESVQQYKDYYESDAEEAQFFEYMEEMSPEAQIRFMEVF